MRCGWTGRNDFADKVELLDPDPNKEAEEVMEKWGVTLMQSGGEMRVRQSAIRIFAQEYSESSLIERGIGEFAPLFIITKLGARSIDVLFVAV